MVLTNDKSGRYMSGLESNHSSRNLSQMEGHKLADPHYSTLVIVPHECAHLFFPLINPPYAMSKKGETNHYQTKTLVIHRYPRKKPRRLESQIRRKMRIPAGGIGTRPTMKIQPDENPKEPKGPRKFRKNLSLHSHQPRK